MRINHNISSLNTYRQMSTNNANTAKNIEKLSSGLRINRAGDDAAGLAISEKMRAQVRGLDMASKNAQDGISLIQTAEGALNETHSILQRMRELAVQASNDTNTTIDRGEIQKEINQLTSEINRIGNTTEFNTQKLLDGSKENGIKTVTAGKAGAAAVPGTPATAGEYTLDVTGLTADIEIDGTTFKYNASPGAGEFSTAAELAALINADPTLSAKYTVSEASDTLTFVQKAGQESATAVTSDFGTVNETTAGVAATPGTPAVPAVAGEYKFDIDTNDITIDGQSFSYSATASATGKFNSAAELKALVDADATLSAKYDVTVSGTEVTLKQKATQESDTAPVVTGNKDNSVALQIGANENQSLSISVSDMRADKLGISSKTGGAGFASSTNVTDGTNNTNVEYSLDVTSSKNAAKAITSIQGAIDKVAAERSKLGAYQNRLEHTINNLGTSSENLTAAESRIRDVDMAKEMMEQTKNNILAQAAQAMLAQANQQPQGVLQLLR